MSPPQDKVFGRSTCLQEMRWCQPQLRVYAGETKVRCGAAPAYYGPVYEERKVS